MRCKICGFRIRGKKHEMGQHHKIQREKKPANESQNKEVK